MTILSSLACQVGIAGISRPAFSDILDTLYSTFRSIYGTDSYIAPDSQDGQLLAAIAKAVDDSNASAVAIYNSFSPATAQGAALSNNVKINGIRRAIPTNSVVAVRVTGQVGTTITGGVASDTSGNRWLIPNNTVIPSAGYADVTATAEKAGNISAAAGTIVNIETPILGWQAVTNTGAAVAGAPVETDAALRKRQTVSVALPSQTVGDGVRAAVLALPGVTQCQVYDNDTNAADSNGVPAHTMAVVVVGGVSLDIATAIMLKKGPGCGTAGSTTQALTTSGGTPLSVKFYQATPVRMLVNITIRALSGYVSSMGDQVKQAIADYINGLGIGQTVYIGRMYLPGQLFGVGNSSHLEAVGISIAASPSAPASVDVGIAFNAVATCALADIALTVI